MNQKHWEKVNSIVDNALELEEKNRLTYIEEMCEGDQQLKTQITDLLASIKESENEGFLEKPLKYSELFSATEAEEITRSPGSSLVGKTIDTYHICELVGHGGMGSVFLAERADGAYEQKVAFKILRRGMDTPSNVARFRRERNILARLDHPCIANLLDGGITDDGLPYLVMEYIEGDTLYDYCDKNRLSLEKRLELFKSICLAVEHAHKNAIIHRDIKPANILITGDGQVKMLDFGIAKIIESETPDKTRFQTQKSSRLLTFGYAAPEQVEGATVTTATDIYVLGILLYELLTGVHAFDLADKSLTESERLIREVPPAHPAKAFYKLSDEKKRHIAHQRNITASSLIKKLQGDLDAIVMKALRKEPDQRYAMVGSLLKDLHHYQTGRPVEAHSGTWRYRTGKFVRRHLWGVGTTIAALVLVAGFIVAMAWQIHKSGLQRDRAVATAGFMKKMFSISDPEKGQGGAMPVRELLQKAVAQLDTSFSDNPITKAELQEVIGGAFRGYGLYHEALHLHRKALAIYMATKGSKSLAVANTRNDIGEVFYYLGRPDSAATYYRQSLNIRRRVLGNRQVEIAQSLNNLALIDAYRGNYARAIKRLKEALGIFQDRLPPDHWRIANILNNLATIRSRQGELQKAEQLYRQALAVDIRLKGENHRDVARMESSLGSIFVREGKLTKADTTLTKALRHAKASTTNKLPIGGEILINLGKIRLQRGNFAEAEHYFRKARAHYLEVLPPDHPRQANALLALGRALLAQGHVAEALIQARKAVVIDE